ncbi:MAG TPA: hypothetical protein VL651_10525 [Bacteroidia bacterium]|nr:hypothetical protein [Bacteroidia bacterium]
MRRYAGKILTILVVLLIAVRIVFAFLPDHHPIIDPSHLYLPDTGNGPGILGPDFMSSISTSWMKDEKGNDSDTLLIPYYDSVARNTDNDFRRQRILNHIENLEFYKQRHLTESLLPGTYDLVYERDDYDIGSNKRKQKRFVFGNDHQFQWLVNNKIAFRDSFNIIIMSQNLSLEFYPHKKLPDGLHWYIDFRLSGDSLSFISPDRISVFAIYVRGHKQK